MKLKELLEKASDFLSAKDCKEKNKRKSLKELVKKLDEREHQLEKKLKDASGGEKKKLGKDLAIVRAQLDKGKKILK